VLAGLGLESEPGLRRKKGPTGGPHLAVRERGGEEREAGQAGREGVGPRVWALRGTEEKGKGRKGRSSPDAGAAGPVGLAAREEKREGVNRERAGLAEKKEGRERDWAAQLGKEKREKRKNF
jgi:hypothetical protein